MNAGPSMDATVLMRKLVEREINTRLLIEFYEEVVENEKVFCKMVEAISTPQDIAEREKSMTHIERFCWVLRELQVQYDGLLLDEEKYFDTDAARREDMINNASRFIEMLEKDVDLLSGH